MGEPQTALDLRRRCKAWPVEHLRSVVLRVLKDTGCPGAEARFLAVAVADWLTGVDPSDPPPLGSNAVRRVWKEGRRGWRKDRVAKFGAPRRPN